MTRTIWISPTQVETYLSCPRKWWFDYVRKMPRDAGQEQFVFGNTLHAVLERWFKADDGGRDPDTGAPVDLYPEGWDDDISPAEASLIRKLVRVGIDSGMLTRYPGRMVEDGYKREVIPGVVMCGKMDVEHRDGLDDHKSSKSRRYFLTEKALADDWKMLCYAHEWVVRRQERDEELPEFLTMRLNYFVKDPDDPFTKPVAVDIEIDAVEGWWNDELIPAAEEMHDLANEDLEDKDWQKVEGPRVDGICKKYRGCPHAPVCGRARAVRAHRKMLERTARPESKSTPQPKPKRNKNMGLLDKAKNRKGGTPTPGAAKEPEEQQPVADTKAVEAQGGTPPWVNESCVACGGSGISRDGTACDPCIKINTRRKKFDPDAWVIGVDDEGNVTWEPADGSGEAESASVVKEPEAKPAKPARSRVTKADKDEAKAAKAEKPARKRVKKTEEPAEETTTDESRKQSAKEAAAPKSSQVDSPDSVSGFVMLCHCSVYRWPGRETVMLSDVLAAEGAGLAEREGADSYYLLHPFNRRNALAADAEAIAAELAGKAVLCPVGSCPDLDALREALIPYAEIVIGGMH